MYSGDTKSRRGFILVKNRSPMEWSGFCNFDNLKIPVFNDQTIAMVPNTDICGPKLSKIRLVKF